MAVALWIPELYHLGLFFAVGILLFWGFYWMMHVMALIYGRRHLFKNTVLDYENRLFPGVSIIKPLVGIDGNLASNLETFFTLKYPLYEILFCVQTDDDPALMLVQSLIAKYPHVPSAVFTGGTEVGVNPKINNMVPGYLGAKYDLILVSDSGIRMKEDTLLDMVSAMTEDVGIVTQMPFTCDRKGFAASLEKVYFGTCHARIYLGADCMGVVCSTGMSSLMRKRLLDEVPGGLSYFAQYLAEDYFIAHSIASRGWKCAIASQPAWQNCSVCQVSNFQNRISRWAKLRFAMMPSTMILEPMQECILLGIFASLSANILFQWNSLIFFLIHVLVWMLSDYLLLRIVQNGPLPFSKFEFLISWLFRELTAFPLFLHSLCKQHRIVWRNGTFRLRWGGVAEKIVSSSNL